MVEERPVHVLFVCMGNICRSPAAEGILKHMVQQHSPISLYVESCGIGDWHVGRPADSRMQEAAKSRGVVLTSLAQQFKSDFFSQFDYILAADHEVLKILYHYAKTLEQKAKIHLITDFSTVYKGQEVPDPYGLGEGAFELVLDILEDSCQGFLDYIRKEASNGNQTDFK